jgi:hypothetical protein
MRVSGQSARQAYSSQKIETGQNGTEAELDEIGGAKVKMCTPVHGLYV